MDDGHNDIRDARGCLYGKRRSYEYDMEGQPDVKARTGLPAYDIPPPCTSTFISDRYNMTHPSRGIAVIINNEDFIPETRLSKRDGSKVDADAMHKLFTTLGFGTVIRRENATVEEMKEALYRVSKQNHTDNDCFVCVILSHGVAEDVYGTDGKVPVHRLVSYFKGDKCPSLAGKPKLFIIQACRGTRFDEGMDVTDAAGEGPMTHISMDTDKSVRHIPTEADFLLAYSVVPGYYAWRNEESGSWFIQAIVDIFRENWEKLDVLTMMTRVSRKVAYDYRSMTGDWRYDGMKQIPCVTSMLTKDMYFERKFIENNYFYLKKESQG